MARNPNKGGKTFDTSPLGLGLGANKKRAAGFRQAAQSGTLVDYLGKHKRMNRRFNEALTGGSAYERDLAQQYVNQTNISLQGGTPAPIDPSLNLLRSPNSIPPPPSVQPVGNAPPAGPGGSSGDYDTPGVGSDAYMQQRDQLLNAYSSPQNEIYQAYMRSFDRGGPVDIPSYQEMYGSYRDTAEKETARRSDQLSNALGARGAFYSSDNLNAQAGLQRDLAGDLRTASAGFLTNARAQQWQENQAMAEARNRQREAAWSRMVQAWQAQSAPPPLFTGQPPQYANPATIAY